MTLSKLIESEIADFFAGFGGPGEPDIESGEAQQQLTGRLLSLLERRERDAQEITGWRALQNDNRDLREPLYLDGFNEPVGWNSDYEPVYSRSAPPAPVAPEELLTAMEEVLRISDRQHDAWDKAKTALSACRAAALNQTHVKQPASNGQSFGNSEQLNSPAVPDGWIMVPKRLTAENGAKAALIGEFNLEYSLTCHECFGQGCDDCSGEGAWTNTIPVDWTTIKDIWAKATNHFTAAPKQESE